MAFQLQTQQPNFSGMGQLIQQADPFSVLGNTMTELDNNLNQRVANDYIKGLGSDVLSNPQGLLSAYTNAPNEAVRKVLGGELKNLSTLQQMQNAASAANLAQEKGALENLLQQNKLDISNQTMQDVIAGTKAANLQKVQEQQYQEQLRPEQLAQEKFKTGTQQELFDLKKREYDLKANKLQEETNKIVKSMDTTNAGKLYGKDKLKAETDIRNEYNKVMGDYIKTKDSYAKIQKTNTDTAAGQMSLIFQYMKMLDPGSTVREGEFANASNTTGISGQILNAYNQAKEGKFLSPKQIEAFKNEAQNLVSALDEKNKNVKNTMMNSINEYGLNVKNIFGKESESVFKDTTNKEQVNTTNQVLPSLTPTTNGLDSLKKNEVVQTTTPINENDTNTFDFITDPNTGIPVKVPKGQTQLPQQNVEAPITGDTSVLDSLGTAGENLLNILKYNASKGGATATAGLANLNEMLGLPSDIYRNSQKYLQEAAQNAETALEPTYGKDTFFGEVAKGMGNPLNYVPVAKGAEGLKLLGGLVGLDTAAEIATKGDRSGVSSKDIGDVALNTSIGLVGGKLVEKGLDKLSKIEKLKGNKTPELDKMKPEDKVKLGEKYGIDLMTSDVFQPKTWFGKLQQETTERLPFVGTGSNRVKQLDQRKAAVERLGEQFNIGDSKEIAANVMDNLSKARAEKINKYSTMKEEVFNNVGQSPVNVSNTINQIDNEITRLQNISDTSYNDLIGKLTNLKNDITKNDGINTLNALRKTFGETLNDTTMAATKTENDKVSNKIYGFLNEDIGQFIKDNGQPKDYKKFKIANEKITGLYDDLKNNTFKNIMNKGEHSPELVEKMLFSADPSKAKLLYKNLNKEGRQNAKSSLLSKIFEESKSKTEAGDEISISKFINKINEPKMKKNIDVFFSPEDKKMIEGLTEVLQMTSRSDKANIMLDTGGKNIAGAITGGAIGVAGATGDLGLLLGGGAVGSLGKVFESKPIINLLIRMNKAPEKVKPAIANTINLLLKRELAKDTAGVVGTVGASQTIQNITEDKNK